MVCQIDGTYSTAALCDDPAALSALFAPLPAGVVLNIQQGRQQAVNRQADKGFRGMRHDPDTDRAFFVVADATRLLVWDIPTGKPGGSRHDVDDVRRGHYATDPTDVAMRVYLEATGRGIGHVQ